MQSFNFAETPKDRNKKIIRERKKFTGAQKKEGK